MITNKFGVWLRSGGAGERFLKYFGLVFVLDVILRWVLFVASRHFGWRMFSDTPASLQFWLDRCFLASGIALTNIFFTAGKPKPTIKQIDEPR